MFGLIKKMSMGLLINIVNTSDHTKCMSLSNRMTQPTLINLHPNEFRCCQEFHYYWFIVKLDLFEVAILDLSNTVCVPNNMCSKKSLSMFNMIMGISESKILTNIKT